MLRYGQEGEASKTKPSLLSGNHMFMRLGELVSSVQQICDLVLGWVFQCKGHAVKDCAVASKIKFRRVLLSGDQRLQILRVMQAWIWTWR